jgi:hypothetical protein
VRVGNQLEGAGGAAGGQPLSVVVQDLEEAAGRLDQTQHAAGELAGGRALSAGEADAAGDPLVAEAIASFVHGWRYGLSCMRADVGSLAGALRRAAAAYRKVEGSITAAEGG